MLILLTVFWCLCSSLTCDVRYAEFHQILWWVIGGQEGADDWNGYDEKELILRESKWSWHTNEHTSLHCDTPTYTCANRHSWEWWWQYQYECFIYKQLRDYSFSESNWSHYWNLFTLLIKVSSHWWWQWEEANEHSNRNDNIEDCLKCFLSLSKMEI